MIAIQHRDGRSITIDGITEEHAALLKPALAPGWALGRIVDRPTFLPLDAPEIAPAKKVRPVKEPKQPSAAHLQALLKFYVPGIEATKAKAREATGLPIDVIDNTVAWMLAVGELAVKGKTYRAVPVAVAK